MSVNVLEDIVIPSCIIVLVTCGTLWIFNTTTEAKVLRGAMQVSEKSETHQRVLAPFIGCIESGKNSRECSSELITQAVSRPGSAQFLSALKEIKPLTLILAPEDDEKLRGYLSRNPVQEQEQASIGTTNNG